MPPQPQSLLQQKLGGMEGQLAALCREMELKEEHDKVLKEQVECLAEDTMKELEDKKGEVQSLTHQFDVVTKKYTILTEECEACLLYTSPSPRDDNRSRMPSSA